MRLELVGVAVAFVLFALGAAGIVASWFGVVRLIVQGKTGGRGVHRAMWAAYRGRLPDFENRALLRRSVIFLLVGMAVALVMTVF